MNTATSSFTLARLFESPGLAGPAPGRACFSPDGRQVAWLRSADDDFERLDLWLLDLASGTQHCLVDARSLCAARALSDAEQAHRERLRIFAAGIVDLAWSQDGQHVYFPLAGRIYAAPIPIPGHPAPSVPQAMTPEELFVTNMRVCPATGAIGFVHARNLYRMLPGEPAVQLTDSGSELISWGLPDFIGAEEMHRFDGYFFSPTGRRIAVLRVDEAPVELSWRPEIHSTGLSAHRQRYPYAGTANARVDLFILDLHAGTCEPLAWRAEDSEYLARIDWCPEDAGLLIQRQPRDQSRLELVSLDLSGKQRLLVLEESQTWVNLTDDLCVIAGGTRALWTSERDDLRRLFEIDLTSGEARSLTPAGVMVERLLRVDEHRGELWIEATFDARVRRQVYRLPLAGGPAQCVSDGRGCHAAVVAASCDYWLDYAESLQTPPSLFVRGRDGERLAALVDNDPLRITHPYHPWHQEHLLPTLGELKAEDGTSLCYRLTRPHAGDAQPCQRHPVILAVYGGPGVRRVTDSWPPLLHQYFARRGWGLLELDNRGSCGRGRAFEAPIFHALGSVEVRDQLVGVKFLRELDWVDNERIAVLGHSYGGYLALMCLAQHPESFRAAVAVAPVTDWRLYDTHYTERYLGHPELNAAAYAASSVFAHLDGLARAEPGALLLIHGMADDNVLFTHSVQLMQALQERNLAFELMTYPGARHGIAGVAASRHRFALIERFLARRFGETP